MIRLCCWFTHRLSTGYLVAVALCVPLLPSLLTAESRGQAEWATQGYFSGLNGVHSGLSGTALRFQHFVDGFGLLEGNLESYGGQGRVLWGENFLELRESPWLDHRWRITGGEFRLPLRMAEFPSSGWIFPELSLRGVRIAAARRGREYSTFYGAQTLSAGPRITYRLTTPYRVAGGSVRYTREGRFRIGLTAYRLSADPARSEAFPYLLPTNRRYRAVANASLQASLRLHRHLQLFGEGSYARPEGAPIRSAPPPNRASAAAGGLWESPKLSAQLSYQRQGPLYLPVAGYLTGDRAGPLAELRVQPFRGLRLHASTSRYTNNLAGDPGEATFRSRTRSAGATAELPGGFSLGGQLTSLRLDVLPAGSKEFERSDNRLLSAQMGRALGRHYLRVTFRELRLNSRGSAQRQRGLEVEESLHWRGGSFGAAVRLDQSVHGETRNSVLARVQAQWRLRGATLFGQFENGRDLLSSSVFTTSAVKAFVAGASASPGGGWHLQAEMFRHGLNLSLNPANVFVLETRGIPLPILLSGFNQWSLFVRLSKTFSWGGPVPPHGLDQWAAEKLPITGSVEGLAIETSRAGKRPAAGVTVRLGENWVAVTDGAGRYRFPEVPEGEHTLWLDLRSLPAEYQPGSPAAVRIIVRSRSLTRQDFVLVRLADLCGRVQGPAGAAVESVVLRLHPAGLRTTPEPDGAFCFYNLPEGSYEIQLEAGSLPPSLELKGPARIPVLLDRSLAIEPPVFQLEEKPAPVKPLRLIQSYTPGTSSSSGQ